MDRKAEQKSDADGYGNEEVAAVNNAVSGPLRSFKIKRVQSN